MHDLTNKIIAWEDGELGAHETLELFSTFITTGLAWTSTGHIGRLTTGLIEDGYLDYKGNILKDFDEVTA